jgi:tRNA threonylcarbamoyl adenosine modification protein YeaZ
VILALETSTRAFSVALFHERVIAGVEHVHEIARSQSIVGTVARMLGDLGLTVNGLEAVYAGLGPGSFTGIRLGLAFANTLLQTRGVPLLGVPTLDLLAFEGEGWYNSAVSLLRSRKSEVYAALYRGGSRVGEYLALGKDELSRFLHEARPERLVCSEDDYRDLGLETGVKTVFAYPRAASAFAFVEARGLKPRHEYLKPLYVRGSHAIPHIHG